MITAMECNRTVGARISQPTGPARNRAQAGKRLRANRRSGTLPRRSPNHLVNQPAGSEICGRSAFPFCAARGLFSPARTLELVRCRPRVDGSAGNLAITTPLGSLASEAAMPKTPAPGILVVVCAAQAQNRGPARRVRPSA
jgi:hypothetical protein